jgi:hypothetical protein
VCAIVRVRFGTTISWWIQGRLCQNRFITGVHLLESILLSFELADDPVDVVGGLGVHPRPVSHAARGRSEGHYPHGVPLRVLLFVDLDGHQRPSAVTATRVLP